MGGRVFSARPFLFPTGVWEPNLNRSVEKFIRKKLLSPKSEKNQKLSTDALKMSGFKFTPLKELETTHIKNQAYTSTCWSFATISFIETELLRMGKGRFELSEMFLVRKTYPRKSERYVRLHGNMAFGASGLAGDALYVIGKHGLVPESAYNGKYAGESKHNHKEMDAVLKAALDAIIKNRGKKLSKAWPKAIEGILDAYLGKVPESFSIRDKEYTPGSFANELGLNPNDYIELTSYTHHPFYTKFSLEVPDNWSLNKYLNLPIDEFMAVIDNAIENGYSLVWDGDITEQTFSQKKGVAILPRKEWDERTQEERSQIFNMPEKEKEVTQEVRQEAFDDYTSTDDHLMHIVGTAHDQIGTKYYKAKNSWGTNDSTYGGFVFLSESYVRAKTISVMVCKEAMPFELLQKLRQKKIKGTSVGQTWFFRPARLKDRES